ncbi:MAG: GDSL-type esterase/lipase family protein [Deltaproteobacteria bacterium]|nr:GDSL-type esterase/lipase family protein [Deltaproteobacteria bacterium]
MLKKTLWFSILFLSLVGIVVLSAGFYQALTIAGQPAPPKATPVVPNGTGNGKGPAFPEKGNALNLLIMGDSIARGAGDEAGKGFSFYLPEDLKTRTPKEIAVENVGIDGLQTDGLLALVQDEKLKPAVAAADLLLVSIGGNDLRRIRRLRAMAKEDGFQQSFAGYATGLTSIVKTLRSANAAGLIIFIGLYYPSLQDLSSDDGNLLLAWNEGTQRIIEQDRRALFIPTYDLFKLNTAKYVALDGLHPNGAGYQAIAYRIGKDIEGNFNKGAEPVQKKN